MSENKAVATTAASPNVKKQLENLLAGAGVEVNVPVAIMKRVNALKNVQLQLLEAESKFYEDLHLLECKYSTVYEPLYDKRSQIINGEYEPTEEESKWALDDDDLDLTAQSEKLSIKDEEKNLTDADIAKAIKAKTDLSDIGSGATTIKGVPDFWLQTFKCVDLIAEMIQEYDEPVLKFLQDVKVKMHDQKPYGYTLEFLFKENDYFTNKTLTKSYELKTDIDLKDPFAYEGPDLYKCKGCEIDWKKGKNVTVRLIKKKQKHKGHGTIRVITKEMKQDSFFNYFDTPVASGDENSLATKSPISSSTEDGHKKNHKDSTSKDHGDEDDDESDKDESLLAADFEIGHFFKERIIPKAVLYFTGEIADDECYDDYDNEDDDEDEDGEDDDNEDEDDDEDEEEDEEPKHNNKGKKNAKGGEKPVAKGGKKGGDPANPADPPECKQQ